jgi:hypothetical protein
VAVVAVEVVVEVVRGRGMEDNIGDDSESGSSEKDDGAVRTDAMEGEVEVEADAAALLLAEYESFLVPATEPAPVPDVVPEVVLVVAAMAAASLASASLSLAKSSTDPTQAMRSSGELEAGAAIWFTTMSYEDIAGMRAALEAAGEDGAEAAAAAESGGRGRIRVGSTEVAAVTAVRGVEAVGGLMASREYRSSLGFVGAAAEAAGAEMVEGPEAVTLFIANSTQATAAGETLRLIAAALKAATVRDLSVADSRSRA